MALQNINFSLKAFIIIVSIATLSGCTPGSHTDGVIATKSADRLFQTKNIEDFGLIGTKKIALTIDDGPYPNVTPRILDLLSRLNIRATFFIVGKQAKRFPGIVARIQNEGHIVANHSFSHANLQNGAYKQRPELLIDEVLFTHKAIAPYMSPAHRMYFRAPYAAWQRANANPLNRVDVLRDYIGPVRWDIGSRVTFDENSQIRTGADWDCWSRRIEPKKCAEGYLREILSKNGGVVLMHDLKMESAKMAEILLPALIARGFKFITLDEIRDLEKYQYRMY